MLKLKCGYCNGSTCACGKPFVEHPIKMQPEKSLAENYKEKTINWKNALWIDWVMILIIIGILISAYGYSHDISKCNEVISNPYAYCIKEGCAPNLVHTLEEPPIIFNETLKNG